MKDVKEKSELDRLAHMLAMSYSQFNEIKHTLELIEKRLVSIQARLSVLAQEEN